MRRPADVDMKGKVCVVTGASGGIGMETAAALARMGAAVLLVCRSKDKGEAAMAEIRRRTPGAKVSLFLADLSSFAEIRRVAKELREKAPKLDVLVNNAGAIHQERKVTADGLEMTFAGNHLNYFLLTHELLPSLEAAAPSRVVSVASDAHRAAGLRGMDFDDLQSAKGAFVPFVAYGRSKLANILFTRELARRVESKGITANCVHPGAVASGFGHNDGGFFGFLVTIGAPFLRSAEKGAWTTIHVATAPELAGVTGKYFANVKEGKPTRAGRNDDAARRLWEVSEKLCGLA